MTYLLLDINDKCCVSDDSLLAWGALGVDAEGDEAVEYKRDPGLQHKGDDQTRSLGQLHQIAENQHHGAAEKIIQKTKAHVEPEDTVKEFLHRKTNHSLSACVSAGGNIKFRSARVSIPSTWPELVYCQTSTS